MYEGTIALAGMKIKRTLNGASYSMKLVEIYIGKMSVTIL